jgi:hypothetical protein
LFKLTFASSNPPTPAKKPKVVQLSNIDSVIRTFESSCRSQPSVLATKAAGGDPTSADLLKQLRVNHV